MRSLLVAPLALAPAAAQDAPKIHTRVKSEAAARPHAAKVGDAALWIDPAKWSWVKGTSETSQTFLFLAGGAEARWLSRAEGGEADAVFQETLGKIRQLDPNAKSVFYERRLVNGAPMICVQIQARQGDLQVLYFGYVFADEQRSHELYVVTTRSTLGDHYEDFSGLLDGLVVTGPDSRLAP